MAAAKKPSGSGSTVKKRAKAPAKKAAAKPAKETALYDVSAHPLGKEIGAVRRIILGVSPAISEGVKWNAPSFRTEKKWFATVNLRRMGTLQIILHLGAKARPDLAAFKIADPDGMMKWLGKDRALVTLGAGREVTASARAFQSIVRAWIAHV